jgi:hypothetical protein
MNDASAITTNITSGIHIRLTRAIALLPNLCRNDRTCAARWSCSRESA